MKKHKEAVKPTENKLRVKDNHYFDSFESLSDKNYTIFPKTRLRRLRKNEAIRDLLQEVHLSVKDMIMPLFVQQGINENIEIESMPGIFRFTEKNILKEIEQIVSLGIKGIIVFGIPSLKNNIGTYAFEKDGIVQKTIKSIKEVYDDKLAVITDVCLCQYTSHGHCGIVKDNIIDNDDTVKILSKIALSHAKAGADIVAPSAMMDGQVRMIRDALDEGGYNDTLIMSYSAKQASSFFSPFRDAAHSKPEFGNRHTYQMSFSNSRESLLEIKTDMEEGADILMIKPAIPNLDLVYLAKQISLHPIAAYSVSGEYSMIKAASINNWIDEDAAIIESITAIKRAGADLIISYYSKRLAELLLK